MAKALYGTLFDWIVLQVNHTLALKQSTVIEVCVLQLVLATSRSFNFYMYIAWQESRSIYLATSTVTVQDLKFKIHINVTFFPKDDCCLSARCNIQFAKMFHDCNGTN